MRLLTNLYRGGTSRGLVFSASMLAPYTQNVRNQIICSAMGSPDPDLRQIDGVGGGVSSLSKVALISVPAVDSYFRRVRGLGPAWAFPGVSWADDARLASDPKSGYHAVYRFGQVPVNDGTNIDWSTTCGNFLSAAAMQSFILHAAYFQRLLPASESDVTFVQFPMRILLAHNGQRATVHLPLTRSRKGHWHLSRKSDTHIAGVPGMAPGIRIDMPLTPQVWPTGQPRNTIQLDGHEIPVSMVDVGLPTIFVHAKDLGVPPEQIIQPAHVLDSDKKLLARIEAVRYQAAQCAPQLSNSWSPSAPKVCLVHPRTAYTTSGGTQVRADDMDILVRAVSVGNFHRSIMATALSALAVGSTHPDSVVSEAYAAGAQVPCAMSQTHANPPALHAFTVGQPAGTSMAMVRCSEQDNAPEAVVLDRTARRIMHGNIDVDVSDELWLSRQTYFGRTKPDP